MDREVRQSMALDLMEPVRPAVENFVLKLLASGQFKKMDFTELRKSLTLWSRKVAPYAEKVAHLLVCCQVEALIFPG